MALKHTSVDPWLGVLTDDRLTSELRVYQRAKGHRFSSDDVATAYVAHRAAPEARRILDLGCGLGSVLLHLAWKLPDATLAGIEAQPMSFELLRRNVERSGYAARIRTSLGDLREPHVSAELGSDFDLITGTPPYFPPTTALDAEDEQRAYARVEYRGGLEAYLTTAARLLGARGVIVLCGDAKAAPRVQTAADSLALHIRAACQIVAREGRPPLFCIWSFEREAGDCQHTRLVLRDARGARTPDAASLRHFSGF
jgi:tRNA1Val (adenine37-N6)-methyltransferase